MKKIANAGKAECRELWLTDSIPKMSITSNDEKHHHAIRLSKDAVRYLGAPEYITFLINFEEGTIAVLSCDEKDNMSFHVPEKLWTKAGADLRIHSKAFVTQVVETFGIDARNAVSYNGVWDAEKESVIFDLEK